MAEYLPPSEDVPIFNSDLFVSESIPLTAEQADKRYLKYPQAQGTETFADIIVGNSSTFSGDMTLTGEGTNLIMDSTTSYAEFRKIRFAGFGTLNASTTLVSGQTGFLIVLAGSTTTITLPAITSTEDGVNYTLMAKNTGGTSITIQRSGTTSLIYPNAVSSFVLPDKQMVSLRAYDSDWYISSQTSSGSGTNLLPLNNTWTGTNDYTNTQPLTSSATNANITTVGARALITKQYADATYSGGGGSILPDNNVWTGTNTFNNNVTMTNSLIMNDSSSLVSVVKFSETSGIFDFNNTTSGNTIFSIDTNGNKVYIKNNPNTNNFVVYDTANYITNYYNSSGTISLAHNAITNTFTSPNGTQMVLPSLKFGAGVLLNDYASNSSPSITINSGHSGKLLILTTSAQTATLPLASSSNGFLIRIVNPNYNSTIITTSTDKINPYNLSSLTLPAGQTIELIAYSLGWIQTGGTYGLVSKIANATALNIPVDGSGTINLQSVSTGGTTNIQTTNTKLLKGANFGWTHTSDQTTVVYYPNGRGADLTTAPTTWPAFTTTPLYGYYSLSASTGLTLNLPAIIDGIIGATFAIRRVNNNTGQVVAKPAVGNFIYPNSVVATPIDNTGTAQLISTTQYACIVKCIALDTWAVISAD